MSSYNPEPFIAEGPQPLVRTTPPGEPYPVHALGALRTAVVAAAGASQVPVAMAAQCALGVASLSVQGFADVETLGGNRPLSLYLLTSQGSGGRKSSVDSYFMKALRKYESAKAKIYDEDHEAWRVAFAIWEARNKELMRLAAKGNDAKRVEARADLAAHGPAPRPPRLTNRTMKEPTYEGIIRNLNEGQPSLGLLTDEGGQFLGGHAMSGEHKQKTYTALNDLWQAQDIQRTRMGDGSLTLRGRRFMSHIMAQPGIVRNLLADPMAEESGFLARYLITQPPSLIGTRLNAKTIIDHAPLADFNARLTAILETPLNFDDKSGALETRLLTLSEDARAILIQFSDQVEIAMGPEGLYCDVHASASKSAEQACRLAGVMTLWADLKEREVSGITMANAVDLAQYYLDEALRLTNAAIVSLDIDRADCLRVWLLEKWPDQDVLPNDIVQRAPITALRERPTALKAIKTLMDAGWLAQLEPDTLVRGKVRKVAYRIVKQQS